MLGSQLDVPHEFTAGLTLRAKLDAAGYENIGFRDLDHARGGRYQNQWEGRSQRLVSLPLPNRSSDG